MTHKQRQQMLELVRELTNKGDHKAAQIVYNDVMADYRNSQAR